MSVYYNEHDPFAASWLRELMKPCFLWSEDDPRYGKPLIAPGEIDTRSVVDVAGSDLRGFTQCHFFAGVGGWAYALSLAGWEGPVWTGSCPCQPFSAAGKQRGAADERHLWPEFARLIGECAPPVVFGEQVASRLGRHWLAGVRADLEALGYAVGAADLCAAGVGAPHIRQRLYWVADTNSGREGLEPGSGGRFREGRSQPHAQSGLGRCGADGRLADAQCDTGDTRRLADKHGEGAGAPPAGPCAEPGRRGVPRRLADSDGGQYSDGDLQRSGQHGQQPQDGGVGGVGDADDARSQGRRIDAGEHTNQRSPQASSESVGVEHAASDGRQQWRSEPSERSAERGCWGRAVLIPCADGKARRIEPGIFPLAHGFPNRVGILRGAGNAIVAQVAAEFIRAYLDHP